MKLLTAIIFFVVVSVVFVTVSRWANVASWIQGFILTTIILALLIASGTIKADVQNALNVIGA